MNQTKGRCQETSSSTIVIYSIVLFMYNCTVLYNAPWIEALSLRTVAKGKQCRDVHKQNDKQTAAEFYKREREREDPALHIPKPK